MYPPPHIHSFLCVCVHTHTRKHGHMCMRMLRTLAHAFTHICLIFVSARTNKRHDDDDDAYSAPLHVCHMRRRIHAACDTLGTFARSFAHVSSSTYIHSCVRHLCTLLCTPFSYSFAHPFTHTHTNVCVTTANTHIQDKHQCRPRGQGSTRDLLHCLPFMRLHILKSTLYSIFIYPM